MYKLINIINYKEGINIISEFIKNRICTCKVKKDYLYLINNEKNYFYEFNKNKELVDSIITYSSFDEKTNECTYSLNEFSNNFDQIENINIYMQFIDDLYFLYKCNQGKKYFSIIKFNDASITIFLSIPWKLALKHKDLKIYFYSQQEQGDTFLVPLLPYYFEYIKIFKNIINSYDLLFELTAG